LFSAESTHEARAEANLFGYAEQEGERRSQSRILSRKPNFQLDLTSFPPDFLNKTTAVANEFAQNPKPHYLIYLTKHNIIISLCVQIDLLYFHMSIISIFFIINVIVSPHPADVSSGKKEG
jgi:hypothetical protein